MYFLQTNSFNNFSIISFSSSLNPEPFSSSFSLSLSFSFPFSLVFLKDSRVLVLKNNIGSPSLIYIF